jgi:hypothetical protein
MPWLLAFSCGLQEFLSLLLQLVPQPFLLLDRKLSLSLHALSLFLKRPHLKVLLQVVRHQRVVRVFHAFVETLSLALFFVVRLFIRCVAGIWRVGFGNGDCLCPT